MDSNQKKFSLYVFLSTFARNLIEVFIPIILYKYGYSLKEVILYYLFVNLFSLILSYPCFYLSNKYNNKILSIIGIISFVILQLLLNNLQNNIIYLLFISLAFATYRRGYWISRRYYNLKIIKKDNISKTYSLISIINEIGLIFSSYIGSLFLDFISIDALTIISIVLFLISTIPLYLLKFEHKETDSKLELIKTIKQIPKNNIYLFGSYELLNVVKFLFPLYLFIYVKNNYQTVGIFNLFANLSTIIFAYIYGKKINNEKNYLSLSILFIIIVYILKLNFSTSILIIIAFLEGIVLKMYELSIQKEFYSLSKKFEYQNYNLVYELTQNIFRTLTVLILYLFFNDLKTMITFVLIIILSSIFIKFKNIETTYYEK